jgi:molecular chaperone IbpA
MEAAPRDTAQLEGIMRNTLDFTPLFRSTIGFVRLPTLLEAAARADEAALGYPPYNIEKLDEDAYRITMAVAGFSADDIEIETREGTLTVAGRREDEDENRSFLHRGIAGRSFQRKFQLADHVRVTGASLEHGLLHVDLAREIPEAMKPRQIAIDNGGGARKITRKSKEAA